MQDQAINSYKKFCPNVFAALCAEQHEKGETITMTTRYGDKHEVTVHNYLGQRDGKFMYSITCNDGFNYKEWCLRRAERREGWAASAAKKGEEYYEKSQKDKDFLALGEPIKVGHHSERRHRKAINDAWKNIGKWIKQGEKAENHESVADYWQSRAESINLSMPESLEYFEFKAQEATEYHAKMKAGEIERSHSYSLTYAKKEANEMKKKLKLAQRLWGEVEK